jgi:hypothetical protein
MLKIKRRKRKRATRRNGSIILIPNFESEDELVDASETAREDTESETAAESSYSSSDSSVKGREEIAEDTQTLEKEEKTGEQLKASVVAQKATNEKRLKELAKMRNNYPSGLKVNVLFFHIARTCIESFLL